MTQPTKNRGCNLLILANHSLATSTGNQNPANHINPENPDQTYRAV